MDNPLPKAVSKFVHRLCSVGVRVERKEEERERRLNRKQSGMGRPVSRPCGRLDEATETKGVRAVARVDGHLEIYKQPSH